MPINARPRGRAHTSVSNGPHSTPVGSVAKIGTPNAPGRYRVCLHEQASGRVMRPAFWTAAGTGEYRFHGLRAGVYFVVAFDHTGQYNGVVTTDIVVPAP
jgi:hypothetical protein